MLIFREINPIPFWGKKSMGHNDFKVKNIFCYWQLKNNNTVRIPYELPTKYKQGFARGDLYCSKGLNKHESGI